MGCGRNISGEMLGMELFCMAITDVLSDFYEGRYHAELWPRIRDAVDFLSYYPEHGQEQRKKEKIDRWDLPKFGLREKGRKRELSYEQLVVTQKYLKSHKKELLEVKQKLPLVLDYKTDIFKRKEAAWRCLKLFSGLINTYHHYFNNPPGFGPPAGILTLCYKDKNRKKKGLK